MKSKRNNIYFILINLNTIYFSCTCLLIKSSYLIRMFYLLVRCHKCVNHIDQNIYSSLQCHYPILRPLLRATRNYELFQHDLLHHPDANNISTVELLSKYQNSKKLQGLTEKLMWMPR